MALTAEPLKIACDWASVSCIVATLIEALPDLAALLAVIWWLLRIYEGKTVQKLLKKWKDK